MASTRMFMFLVSLFVTYVAAQQEASLVSCVRGSTATEIIATIRVKINGADITQLTAYNQAGNTAQTCTTNTITGGIIELAITFDENAPTCGIVQDATVNTQFNIRVHAIGTSLEQAYLFSCDNTNLLVTNLDTGKLTVTGQLSKFGLYERNKRDVRLQAVLTDTDLPATSVDLGREIYFRIIFNKGTEDFTNTNFGYYFYVGFLKTTTDAVLTLDIYTPAHGTRVFVKGEEGGDDFEEILEVKRDQPIRYTVPAIYQPTSTTATLHSEDKAIEIIGLDAPIGVRVNSEKGVGYTDSYVAYPREVLGVIGTNSYRLPTVTGGASTAQAIFLATESPTNVKLFHNSLLVDESIFADGQMFHMFCGTTCADYVVESDKPIAVITGNGQETLDTKGGHMMTPTLPTAQFGRHFVILKVRNGLSTAANYKLLYSTEDYSTTYDWTYESQGTSPTSIKYDSAPITLSSMDDDYHAEEIAAVTSGQPAASVTQFLTGTSTFEPAMVAIPSVEQWGTVQIIPVKGGLLYDLVIVSSNPDVKVSSNLFEEQTSLVDSLDMLGTAGNDALEGVAPLPGTSATKFKMQYVQFTSSIALKWVKLKAKDPKDTFIVLVYEIDSDNTVQAFSPFGQRATPASTSCTSTNQQPGTGIYPGVRLGDGLNNDCDQATDEEILNGKDDDGDGRIDEDLAAAGTTGDVGVQAVYNTGLEIAVDQGFTAPVTLIKTDGCNEGSSGAITSVGHFIASSVDNTNYPDYWTIRTNDFPAFRFINEESVWARATVGFCDDQTGLCLDSCASARRRRDVSTLTKKETVYLQLNIVDPGKNDTVSMDSSTTSCHDNTIFWSTVAIMVILVVFEVCVISVLVRKRYRLGF